MRSWLLGLLGLACCDNCGVPQIVGGRLFNERICPTDITANVAQIPVSLFKRSKMRRSDYAKRGTQ